MALLRVAVFAASVLYGAVAGDHLTPVHKCWTPLGTVGTCQTLKRCGLANSYSFVLQSLQTRLCYWRSGKPYVCCPERGGAPSGGDFWPNFSVDGAAASSTPEPATASPAAPAPTLPTGLAPPLSGEGPRGTAKKKMKVDNMPTVEPFPMRPSETRPRRPRPTAASAAAPADDQLEKICGRSDPLVLADQDSVDILRHLYPDIDPVFAVPGGPLGKEARVTGGIASVKGRWPWMAVIGKVASSNVTWLCGGSIIDEYHVITAAHCVQRRPNVVRFGDSNIARDFNSGDQSEERRIRKITLHPKYRPPRSYHDLAVVTLRRPIQFSRFVRPICLPPSDLRLRRGQTAKITGHGYQEFNEGRLAPQLQEAQIQLVRRKVCNASYAKLGGIFFEKFPRGILSHVICAGQKDGGVDACQGDSGGPLMQHNDATNAYYQIGVIGSGFGCGHPDFPGLYTSVKHHLDFIHAVVRSQRRRAADLVETIIPRR